MPARPPWGGSKKGLTGTLFRGSLPGVPPGHPWVWGVPWGCPPDPLETPENTPKLGGLGIENWGSWGSGNPWSGGHFSHFSIQTGFFFAHVFEKKSKKWPFLQKPEKPLTNQNHGFFGSLFEGPTPKTPYFSKSRGITSNSGGGRHISLLKPAISEGYFRPFSGLEGGKHKG